MSHRFTVLKLAAVFSLTATTTLAAARPAQASVAFSYQGDVSGPATHEQFNAANFSAGATIDNPLMTRTPGAQSVLEGTADRGGGVSVHRLVVTVTDLTKEIDGVTTRVLFDQDFNEGKLSEAEIAFHAQDNGGNVWNLGEYPEEYEDGVFAGAPSTWLSGISDARGGVMMRKDPQPGTATYFQGVIPSIQFADIAEIVGYEPRVCIKLGCYDNVLVVKEANTFFPEEGFQLKYYAKGVGNIKVDFLGGQEQEVLELVERRTLTPSEMDSIRAAALRLDRRAYGSVPAIFGSTERANRC